MDVLTLHDFSHLARDLGLADDISTTKLTNISVMNLIGTHSSVISVLVVQIPIHYSLLILITHSLTSALFQVCNGCRRTRNRSLPTAAMSWCLCCCCAAIFCESPIDCDPLTLHTNRNRKCRQIADSML